MKERWAILDQWPGYKISDHGCVFSLRQNRLLRLSSNKMYLRVHLFRDGAYSNVAVHRLVAFAFVDGYFDGAFVNHKDANKMNNHYRNLEWVTPTQNVQHAARLGLLSGPRGRKIPEPAEDYLKRMGY